MKCFNIWLLDSTSSSAWPPRDTHANTLKYIHATLVSNFGNFYAVAIGSLLISFLPMLPKQLLLLKLLTDFLMMVIALDRVSEQEVARP